MREIGAASGTSAHSSMLASLQRCQAQKLDAGGVIYVPPRVTRRERRTVEMQHTYAAKTIQAALRRRNHRNEVNASNNPYGLIRGMRRASDQEYISSSPLATCRRPRTRGATGYACSCGVVCGIDDVDLQRGRPSGD